MKRTRILFILCVSFAFIVPSRVQAQIKQEDIAVAIHQSAAYIANVLLDKEGKSRCDYNLTEGKWYDYEVPWHTGQAVNALLAAYKQTGNKSYLAAAERGGKYWKIGRAS